MANYIELITKYSSQAWDKVYKREAISSMFDAQPGLFQFTGAKTVKIASWQVGGLSDYTRNNEYTGADEVNGYQKSTMQLVWQEYTIDQDRGAKIPIEKFDDEETDGLAVGATTTELSRVVIIPEVDAYFFSKVYQEAAAAGTGNVVSGSIEVDGELKPLHALNEGLTYLENMEVPAENQVIAVSPTFFNALRNSKEVTKILSQADFDKDVKFRLTEYEGRKLVVVPPQRFNTEVELHENGFTLKGEPIDFMIMPKDALVHIVKYNKVKVLDGDLALAASNQDGFVVYARIYHDVFVTRNKRVAIYAHTDGLTYSGIAAGAKKINLVVKDGKVKTLTMLPLEMFVLFGVSSTEVKVGQKAKRSEGAEGDFLYSPITEGSTITAEHYVYAIDVNGKVLAVEQYKAA